MKSSSLPIAALAAVAITSAHAATQPQVGDIITLPVQTLACFDIENTKELERTRAMEGLSAALHFIDRHPLPDDPATGTIMFAAPAADWDQAARCTGSKRFTTGRAAD